MPRRAGLAALAAAAPGCACAQTAPERAGARPARGRPRLPEARASPSRRSTTSTPSSSGFPDTDSVDDALLEIGRYHLEVEGDAEQAREAFEQVAKRFPQSDGAPGAYYYLGRLTLERATTAAELDDALAQFARVQRLYPRSEWVPRRPARRGARAPQGGPPARGGRSRAPGRARVPDQRGRARPRSSRSGHAWRCMGEPRQAMEEFQQVRNRFPDSEWAPRALDRITALYRLYGGAPSPPSRPTRAFALGAGDVLKDVRALLMTPARHALDRLRQGRRARCPFGPDGKMGASLAGDGPAQPVPVAAGRAGGGGASWRCAWARATSSPSPSPATSRASRSRWSSIEAALLTPGGDVLVADGKRKRVLPLRRQVPVPGPVPRRQGARGHAHGARRRRRHRAARPRREDGARASTRRASCCARWPARGTGYELQQARGRGRRRRSATLYVADEEARRARVLARRASSWPR